MIVLVSLPTTRRQRVYMQISVILIIPRIHTDRILIEEEKHQADK